MTKINRNAKCPCGSGLKYKNCCLPLEEIKSKFSSHSKRMFGISIFAPPPPWSKQFDEFNKFIEDVVEPQVDEKEVIDLFQRATTKVTGTLINGAGLICDQNLRYFYQEFNDRLFNHGLWSFPSSFNVGEAFMRYIPTINCFELLDELDYMFSFEDYMDFVTSENCNDDYKNALFYFEEGKIYHFNNTDPLDKFTFKTKDNSEYVFSGISLVRHEDELNLLMTIGEKTNTKLKDEFIKSSFKLDGRTPPAKKNIMPDENKKMEAVRLNGIENYWHQIVMSRFDFSDYTQNVRYIFEDWNQFFINHTDDMDVFTNNHGTWENDETIIVFHYRPTKNMV